MRNRREWHLPGTLDLLEGSRSGPEAVTAFGAALHARLETAEDRVRQESLHLDHVEAVASAYWTVATLSEVRD